MFSFPSLLTAEHIAQLSLLGTALDALGGCYLAYDLLGGKNGPLRTIGRATGYVALFFLGYIILLGPRYAIVAAAGMGIILALEYRIAGTEPADRKPRRSNVILFAFLRGVVLGLAGMTIAGLAFGFTFGLLSGAALAITYAIGFSPTDDYTTNAKPKVSRHKLLASLVRALAVGAAGIASGLLLSRSHTHAILLGFKLGLAAGIVSALVGAFSPAIEWWIEHLPDRRLGVAGLCLILTGLVLQSVQYWVVVFKLSIH